MRRFSRVNFAWFDLGVFAVLGSVLALILGLVLRAHATDGLPCRDGGDDCINIGFTDAWFNGETRQLGYSHPFFCARPPNATGMTGCEAGEPAITAPPSGPVVSEVYLIIPVGFTPPESTVQCPVP